MSSVYSVSRDTLWEYSLGGGLPYETDGDCSSEILNLTPKGDQFGRGLSKFWPLKETA